MATILIDYTQRYYQEVAGAAIPTVISGKFVRIRGKAADHLAFSPKGYAKYHANIVDRFCADKGIKGSYNKEGTKFIIADTAWEVLGGGKYDLDRNKKTVKLYDNSMAYGKFDRQWLQDSVQSIHDFEGFTVQTE
jgi:hypothetical protein